MHTIEKPKNNDPHAYYESMHATSNANIIRSAHGEAKVLANTGRMRPKSYGRFGRKDYIKIKISDPNNDAPLINLHR